MKQLFLAFCVPKLVSVHVVNLILINLTNPLMSSEWTESSLGIKYRKPKAVVSFKERVILIWEKFVPFKKKTLSSPRAGGAWSWACGTRTPRSATFSAPSSRVPSSRPTGASPSPCPASSLAWSAFSASCFSLPSPATSACPARLRWENFKKLLRVRAVKSYLSGKEIKIQTSLMTWIHTSVNR